MTAAAVATGGNDGLTAGHGSARRRTGQLVITVDRQLCLVGCSRLRHDAAGRRVMDWRLHWTRTLQRPARTTPIFVSRDRSGQHGGGSDRGGWRNGSS